MTETKKPQFTILMFETFVRAAENAPGTMIFRSLMARNEATGKVVDILHDGDYSCAFFVSSLLALCSFMPKSCTTVDSLEKRMREANWKEVGWKDAKPGDIVIWEEVVFDDGSRNRHAGIALSSAEAVSTDYRSKSVMRHHITFGVNKNGDPKRKIEHVFRIPRD